MNIVKVVPLINLPRSQSQFLSYFSSAELSKGCVVEISVGRARVCGIVYDCFPLGENKLSVKKAGYSLKPISKVINSFSIVNSTQINLIEKLADFYFLPLSGLFKAALPDPSILAKISAQSVFFDKNNSEDKKIEHLLLNDEDFSFLKNEIESVLASSGQILFLFPNQVLLDFYLENFSKRKMPEPVVLDKTGSKRNFIKAWEICSSGQSRIFFGKKSAIFAPFFRLKTVVLIDENNASFDTWETEIHFSARKAVWQIAEIHHSKIIFCGKSFGIDSYFLFKNKVLKMSPSSSLEKSNLKKTSIFPLKEKNKALSSEILSLVSEAVSSERKILFFVNRRGFSSSLICRDCGHFFHCPDCEAPMSFYSFQKQLRCRHCGKKSPAPNVCPNCGGFWLKFSGLGAERILMEIKSAFPECRVEIFDADHLTSFRSEFQIFEKFTSGEIRILVATELFSKFLEKVGLIDLIIMISPEQSLVFPDFRSEERLRNDVLKLGNAAKNLIVQEISGGFSEFFKKNILASDFYEKELNSRLKSFYPPFSDVVRISFFGKNIFELEKKVNLWHKELNRLLKINFSEQDYRLLPVVDGFIPKIRGNFIKEIFFRIKSHPSELFSENIKKRNDILNRLPDEASIKINPFGLM